MSALEWVLVYIGWRINSPLSGWARYLAELWYPTDPAHRAGELNLLNEFLTQLPY